MAVPRQEAADPATQSWPRRTLRSKDNAPGNDQLDLGSGGRRTQDGEFATDASGSLAHPLQSKVSVLSVIHDKGIDPHPVVFHAQSQILGIADFHVEAIGP